MVALSTPFAALYDPIVELVQPVPSFHLDALCQEHPEINWFPGQGESAEPARAVCARCLVRFECAEYALEVDEKHGVWGGTSGLQRRHARAAGWTVGRLLYEIDTRVDRPAPVTAPCRECGGQLSRKDAVSADGWCWACRPV